MQHLLYLSLMLAIPLFGKSQKIAEMNRALHEIIALGSKPEIPTALRTTMIIGAMARMGMVCEEMTHGIDRMVTTAGNTWRRIGMYARI